MSNTMMSHPWTKASLWIGGVGATLTGLAYPEQTATAMTGLAAASVVWSGYQITDWLVEFPHRWHWVTPLHRTLAGPLGIDPDARPRSYIKIARGYQNREEVGKIFLPVTFTGTDLQTTTTIVRHKLGLTDVTMTYQLAGRRPHIVLKQTPRPPSEVMFVDHQLQVESAREPAPLIGIGPKGRQVSVDLDAESPHILVSASTGGGKSVITRTMAAQVLHNGGQMVVCDFKRHSQRWANRLPQVNYCKEIGEIHDALVSLGQTGHQRNRIVDEWEDSGEPDVGPRLVVLLEEANATIAKLKRYWTAIRKTKADEDGPADPKESPAIDALREILFMGRAVKMHVLLVAQSATATALGGPEVRECFATRILSRYTQNAWKMLVPEVSPIPRSTRHIGRAQVVLGGVATETQVLLMTNEEAETWAMSGVVAPAPSVSRHAPPKAHNHALTSNDLCDVTSGVTLSLVEPPRYHLAAAAREEIVPLSADALRQAKRRDPNFPKGQEGRWTAVELREWYESRSA
ncbi:pRL2-11 [Streptomyces sp. NPDC006208]|uniref:pRL2-11 n=1 Tax=Streptomyces sp. NPDC006208 TaxID=3156734 RepID=UPI0033B4C112